MKQLTPVSPSARIALGIAFFVLFVAVWAAATLGGFVSKTFLADPITMVRSGYTLLTGGGAVATADVLNAILTESGSSVQAPAGLGGDIPLSATLHNVHATLGWRWLLANDHLVIRASVSYLQTLASRIDVKIPASASVLVPYQGMINDQVNAYLAPFFAKYAKAPTLGLSAAVRF